MAIVAALAGGVVVGVLVNQVDANADLLRHAAATTGGDPGRGQAVFLQYGCGSCHKLSNVRKATGLVGPPLDGIAARVIIAGRLPNSPSNLQRWIRNPDGVSPGTDMPDLHVSARDARDISAFLYTRE
jgi:cytochrome c2